MSPSKKRALRQQSSEFQSPQEARLIDRSTFVSQRDKINWSLTIRERNDLTARQLEIIDLILDKKTKVVFLNGPAGSSKTFMAVLCGLKLLNERKMSHINYIRTAVESASKSLGYLKGDMDEKMEPYLMPLTDKMGEMLAGDDVKRLMAEKRIVGLPINYLRGASMNAQFTIFDEAQNATCAEVITALTRLGQHAKMLILGDASQSDLQGGAPSGFMPLFDLFNDESSRNEGIHCVSLTKDDIVRSGITRYLVERLESFRPPTKTKNLQ